MQRSTVSDPDRCRATAARYARLAGLSENADVRRAYLEIESLWLEAAAWTERLRLDDNPAARQRLYDLVDASGARLREITPRLH